MMKKTGIISLVTNITLFITLALLTKLTEGKLGLNLLIAVVFALISVGIITFTLKSGFDKLKKIKEDLSELLSLNKNKDYTLEEVTEGIKDLFAEYQSSIEDTYDKATLKEDELFKIYKNLDNVSKKYNTELGGKRDKFEEVITNIKKTNGEIDEITLAANIAAETSLKTLELTSSTVELAESGVRNVEKSLNKIGEIKENTDNTAESVVKLEEKANEIGGIVNSITKISEQTNLLALNAAIEAARAGEAGKGFAVVAQEIRGLADESRKAAENINNIVAVIQNQTKQAMEKMNKTSEVVQEGAESSTAVGESLTIMLDSINKINNMMQDVAAGAQQQSANTHEIADQMELNAKLINEGLGEREMVEEAGSIQIQELNKVKGVVNDITKGIVDLNERFSRNKGKLKGIKVRS